MKVGFVWRGSQVGLFGGSVLAKNPGIRVDRLCRPGAGRLGLVHADTARRMRGYEQLERMIEGETLDLVMIGSPNGFHYDQLCVVLSAGVRAFCEKPVVISEEQTFRLLDTLYECGTDQVIVGLVLRYAPMYVDLLRLVNDGVLGDIVSVEASEHIETGTWGVVFFATGAEKRASAAASCWKSVAMIWICMRRYSSLGPWRVASFGGRAILGRRMSD